DVVVEREPEPRAADAGGREFLGDDLVEAEVVRPAPAVLLGDGDADEAVLAGGSEHLTRRETGALPLHVMRCHLVGDPCRERLSEGLVVLLEQSPHGANPTNADRGSQNATMRTTIAVTRKNTNTAMPAHRP